MNNDQKIIDLLKSRAVVQRRLRDNLEDLEAVTNEIENEIARVEGREAVRKVLVLKTVDATSGVRGE
jgi:DNA-directed RNA polymerase specialized sigma subunit